jgi:hypothetical protein
MTQYAGRPGSVECLMLQKTRETRDISLKNDHGLPKFVPCGPPTHSDAGLRNHGCRPSRSWGRKALEKHSIGRLFDCCGDLSGLVGIL